MGLDDVACGVAGDNRTTRLLRILPRVVGWRRRSVLLQQSSSAMR